MRPMPSSDASDLRQSVREAILADEAETVERLIDESRLDAEDRAAIHEQAVADIEAVRASARHGLMETFLAEYGLSTEEGVALMCLAEALLRVPDRLTIDALIQDKIASADWARHLGHSSSMLVNASTWALMLTGKILHRGDEEEDLADILRGAVRRIGEPVIRQAVAQAMRELGQQFVLGRTIEEAIDRGRNWREKGYLYSYDMLGEAAHTEADAARYHLSYSRAISVLAGHSTGRDIRLNPGISVKLSALHPRYEFGQRDRVMKQLTARTRSLALLARSANMGFNIDAEEADRLDLSLDVIEAVLSDPALEGWDGFGVVVQAYGQRAAPTIDWLADLARRLERRIMVRLVKGAYWDTEIKRAQTLGLDGYPVFTAKANTDVSYLACARKLLDAGDCIFPQFATHNAHTIAAVLHMADPEQSFELQRLHGMGEELHEAVRKRSNVRTRIYAPVGAHRDLLAYLVRRLLENGANSSFVNQILDEDVTTASIAADPIDKVRERGGEIANPRIPMPRDIFAPRRNALGLDITDPLAIERLDAERDGFRHHQWAARPMLAGGVVVEDGRTRDILNPADPDDVVGTCTDATAADVDAAFVAAETGFADWRAVPVAERAAILEKVADAYEAAMGELIALASREAGKTPLDGVAEVREAVDFCRYYASEALKLEGDPRGTFVCISPWNFPLAIFTGQIAAALAAGNTVLAKPAEQTPLMAARAVELMHGAGVPVAALQLVPGDGPTVGQALVGDPRVRGVCFTGSTQTAQAINRAMAGAAPPDAPLIAETGGLNAMIVDSTALPEQAVRDIVASAFQSAGQRCSALRVLYVQKDIEDRLVEMLSGAMEELAVGDPWQLSTDVGPVIDAEALEVIDSHCARLDAEGRLIKTVPMRGPRVGHFRAPSAYRVSGIGALEKEIFGPVLHVATFEADELDAVIGAINRSGYGLTFGLHTRIEARVQHVVDRVEAGNLYVNRNQIGAVVGSQPFGGEGLSGTGPKAGGPRYLPRFQATGLPESLSGAGGFDDEAGSEAALGDAVTRLRERFVKRIDPGGLREALAMFGDDAAPALAFLDSLPEGADQPLPLPGPTGESNQLNLTPRGLVLCLGAPGENWRRAALLQMAAAVAAGNRAVVVGGSLEGLEGGGLTGPKGAVEILDGACAPGWLEYLPGIAAVLAFGDAETLRPYREVLARRPGPLTPLLSGIGDLAMLSVERALCVDTTASGGNASLLASANLEAL